MISYSFDSGHTIRQAETTADAIRAICEARKMNPEQVRLQLIGYILLVYGHDENGIVPPSFPKTIGSVSAY